jgi:hypothetical protein
MLLALGSVAASLWSEWEGLPQDTPSRSHSRFCQVLPDWLGNTSHARQLWDEEACASLPLWAVWREKRVRVFHHSCNQTAQPTAEDAVVARSLRLALEYFLGRPEWDARRTCDPTELTNLEEADAAAAAILVGGGGLFDQLDGWQAGGGLGSRAAAGWGPGAAGGLRPGVGLGGGPWAGAAWESPSAAVAWQWRLNQTRMPGIQAAPLTLFGASLGVPIGDDAAPPSEVLQATEGLLQHFHTFIGLRSAADVNTLSAAINLRARKGVAAAMNQRGKDGLFHQPCPTTLLGMLRPELASISLLHIPTMKVLAVDAYFGHALVHRLQDAGELELILSQLVEWCASASQAGWTIHITAPEASAGGDVGAPFLDFLATRGRRLFSYKIIRFGVGDVPANGAAGAEGQAGERTGDVARSTATGGDQTLDAGRGASLGAALGQENGTFDVVEYYRTQVTVAASARAHGVMIPFGLRVATISLVAAGTVEAFARATGLEDVLWGGPEGEGGRQLRNGVGQEGGRGRRVGNAVRGEEGRPGESGHGWVGEGKALGEDEKAGGGGHFPRAIQRRREEITEGAGAEDGEEGRGNRAPRRRIPPGGHAEGKSTKAGTTNVAGAGDEREGGGGDKDYARGAQKGVLQRGHKHWAVALGSAHPSASGDLLTMLSEIDLHRADVYSILVAAQKKLVRTTAKNMHRMLDRINQQLSTIELRLQLKRQRPAGLDLASYVNKHQGQTIYVVGSGATAGYISRTFFEGQLAIGVNQAYRRFGNLTYLLRKEPISPVPFARVLADSGSQTIHFVARGANGFVFDTRTAKVVLSHYRDSTNVVVYEHAQNAVALGTHRLLQLPPVGQAFTPRLVASESTITTAIHLAAVMGASRIILVGHDLDTLDGESNYADYHSAETLAIAHGNVPLPLQKFLYSNWIRGSGGMKQDSLTLRALLQERYPSIHVYSLSPFIGLQLEGHRVGDALPRQRAGGSNAALELFARLAG